MIASALALLAAVLLGLSSILAKKGLKDFDILSGLIVSLSVNFVIFWVLAVPYVSPIYFESTAVLFFILSGLLGSALGRYFKYLGFDRVGVSLSRPIVNSQPFFATIIAIAILRERLTLPAGIGTSIIILGIALISQSGEKTRKWKKRWLLFPLFSASCFGTATVIDKIGLNIFPSPILGATISVSAALSACMLFFVLLGRAKDTSVNRRGLSLFCGAGICEGGAILCMYYALSLGTVILVSPLINTSPLFALFFSHLFLKDAEKVTRKIVIAAVLIVIGATIITFY